MRFPVARLTCFWTPFRNLLRITTTFDLSCGAGQEVENDLVQLPLDMVVKLRKLGQGKSNLGSSSVSVDGGMTNKTPAIYTKAERSALETRKDGEHGFLPGQELSSSSLRRAASEENKRSGRKTTERLSYSVI